jgi:hypothetical protein
MYERSGQARLLDGLALRGASTGRQIKMSHQSEAWEITGERATFLMLRHIERLRVSYSLALFKFFAIGSYLRLHSLVLPNRLWMRLTHIRCSATCF